MTGEPGTLAGSLLVATPLLADPSFTRTVVLLVDHDSTGAVGVVLNRPGERPLQEVAEPLAGAAAAPAQVFLGGPVSPDLTVCLSAAPGLAAWTVLDLTDPPEMTGPLRVFQGYAGWGPGQLEREVAEGAWWVLPASPQDVFCADPAQLWRQVLRRSPPPVSYASTWPEDPGLN